MDFETIYQHINSGMYQAKYEPLPKKLPPGHIEDTNKSVRWNQEFVQQKAQERINIEKHNQTVSQAAQKLFSEHLILAIQDACPASKRQAHLLYEKAWEDGHSYGYTEVVNHACELSSLFKDLMADEPAGISPR